MSLADFQKRIQQATSDCGLNRINLGGLDIDVDAFHQAAQETSSPEALRAIAKTTMQAMVIGGVADAILQSQGLDLMDSSLFDLASTCASYAGGQLGDLMEHGGHLVDAASTATDVADAAMGVATGGLTILTSMAASYFVGKYVGAKRDQRQEQLRLATAELIRRQSFAALRQAVRSPDCSPKELAQPVLLLLKAGDVPAALA